MFLENMFGTLYKMFFGEHFSPAKPEKLDMEHFRDLCLEESKYNCKNQTDSNP